MKWHLCAYALLGMAAPAEAADWWLVSQARDFAGFVDRESIDESFWNGERTATLRRIEYRTGPNGEKSHIVQARFDCRRNVMTIVSTKTYDRGGNEIGHFWASRPEQEPQHVGRGTAGRSELDFICEKPSKTQRFARRAETDPQHASDRAFRLHRLGFTFTDAFALTLTNPDGPDYPELFAELVPSSKADDVLDILGLEPPSEADLQFEE